MILDGILVVEVGVGRAVAVAGMILAENGARVLKIEPPGGDPLRTSFPSAFLVWNRGKESVELDLRQAAGQAEIRRLALSADVLIEAFEAGTAERLGIVAEDLSRGNRGLVYCSIKGFPRGTAYAGIKGHDGLIAAKTGHCPPALFRDGPMYPNFQQGTYGAAHLAVQGVLAALLVREATGSGQQVESTLYQGQTAYDLFEMIEWHVAKRRPDLAPPRAPDLLTQSLISERLLTKDGRWVEFNSILPHQFRAYIRVLGMDGLWEDPLFETAPYFVDPALREHFRDMLFARFRERTLDDWMPTLLAEKDLIFEPVATTQQALAHPQVVHNGAWTDVIDPQIGRIREVGPLAVFSETPSRVGTSAPVLGAHDARIAPRRTARHLDQRPESSALSGVTIVEFASFYAGTFCATLLGELGARVIKVEDLNGDPWRAGGTYAVKTVEGKESIAVDLRASEGMTIFQKLIARANAFVFGMRPTSARRLGITYEALRTINPRLIYLYAGGYGAAGPYADRGMYGNTTKAMMGGSYRQAGRWIDPERTRRLGIRTLQSVAQRLGAYGSAGGDPESALGRATVLMLALVEQRRSGRGQYIETSMVNLNAYANAEDFCDYAGKPIMPLPDEDLFGLDPLYRLYPTSAGWVFLACPTQEEWLAFRAASGAPGLSEARFATVDARARHCEELTELLISLFAERTAESWESLLAPRGVGCAKVFEGGPGGFSCTDEAIREAGLVVEVEHPRFGRYLRHGRAVTLTGSEARLAAGSEAGQHTRAILEELGYSSPAIAQLIDSNVVGTWDGASALSSQRGGAA